MVDNGNETRPKLIAIEGGKGRARDEGLSYEGVDGDLERISIAAKLKPSAANALSGPAGSYEITVERYVDLGTRSVTLSLFYPTTDPDVVLEGFTIKGGGTMTEEQRYSHTETLRNNPEPVVTRGLEAEPKIRDTLRRVKQIAGVVRAKPQTSF